ncbi:MAG: 3-dehydroquinate dehydratase [Bacteroidetes bacterium]|nr:3-dehydroquinate dehydratase [Bacteroidota bacterium]
MKILILNGPNLNLLGARDSNYYGDLTLDKIEEIIKKEFPEIEFEFFQTNYEGELINKIQNAINNFNGIIINPGGYAHTSVALRDSLTECKLPKIEVHLSHLVNRENFRQNLITASGCDGYISGFKENSYLAAVYLIIKMIRKGS